MELSYSYGVFTGARDTRLAEYLHDWKCKYRALMFGTAESLLCVWSKLHVRRIARGP
ncbi:hypothetical protein EJ08DRAFT_284628 [Tothia fuscella]|uniref:Uncharacterized protein n=1 Tax=Tothia fuscella TaxID=1048955 RepID=A0A9P4P1N5_9PEZI|nr:hypothetical protein EJ08DRAFT_284628 [Tothia fuscella]